MNKKLIITGKSNQDKIQNIQNPIRKDFDKTIISYKEMVHGNQINIIRSFYFDETFDNKEALYKIINSKLSSYRQQDITKKLFNNNILITFEQLIEKLLVSKLVCYYCKENVKLFYEYVRDNNQWTLDRIDNNCGHTNDNVVIACLKCNLKRGTLDSNKFLFTKRLKIKKID